jgi:biotin carboxylase
VTKTVVWFTHGYSNLYHAIHDLKTGVAGSAFTVLCSHPNRDFVAQEAADCFLPEPRVKGRRYLEYVHAVARQYGVDVLFPSLRQSELDEHRAYFRELDLNIVTVADAATLHLINDKAALYAYLRGRGVVEVPEFRTAATRDDFLAAYEDLRQRYKTLCFKPTRGVYGQGFRILKDSPDRVSDILSESQTLNIDRLLAQMGSERFPSLLLMQFLEGAERSVDCLAYEGRLIGGVIRRKSPRVGAAQVIEDNPKLLEQVAQLTELLKLNGMFNVQFRDTGRHHYLLEINARLSGRSYYATLAGFNLPQLAAQLFSGQKSPDELTFEIRTGQVVANVSNAVVLHKRPSVAGFSSSRCAGDWESR